MDTLIIDMRNYALWTSVTTQAAVQLHLFRKIVIPLGFTGAHPPRNVIEPKSQGLSFRNKLLPLGQHFMGL